MGKQEDATHPTAGRAEGKFRKVFLPRPTVALDLSVYLVQLIDRDRPAGSPSQVTRPYLLTTSCHCFQTSRKP